MRKDNVHFKNIRRGVLSIHHQEALSYEGGYGQEKVCHEAEAILEHTACCYDKWLINFTEGQYDK